MSPFTSQLCTTISRKVMIKYARPVVICKIIDPHNYQLMMLRWQNTKRTFLKMKD